MPDRVLLVDDDEALLTFLQELLADEGFETLSARSGPEALNALARRPCDLALCDIVMPGMGGFALLDEIRRTCPGTDVIFMTGYGSREGAIEAMARGAVDYLMKPLSTTEVVAKLRSHLRRRRLEAELLDLHAELRSRYGLDKIVAVSAAMQPVLAGVRRLAGGDEPVVLLGEPGSGRDFLARTLHYASARSKEPYRVVVPTTPALADLRGALGRRGTGGTPGRGTLHLRGVAELSAEDQGHVAQALARDPGSLGPRLVLSLSPADPELAAPLRAALQTRPTLRVPPLRERAEDLPELVGVFLAYLRTERGRSLHVPAEVLELLGRESFPGNVAQLFAALERAESLSTDGLLGREAVEQGLERTAVARGPNAKSMAVSLEEREYQLVLEAVSKHRGQLEMAARELGVSRTTLWRRMRKYGIRALGPGRKPAVGG